MAKKDYKKELTDMLEELKEDLEYNPIDDIRKKSAESIIITQAILGYLMEGKTIVEASSKCLRSYDDALAKCLDKGAKADDDFMYAFTVNYLCNILGIISNLFLVEDFAKDKDNLAFLKSKVRECLIYIDRL